MSSFDLLRHQLRFDLMAMLRNKRARVLSIGFPLVFLVVFAGVFGDVETTVDGVAVAMSRFYVPGIVAMTVIFASYGTLVNTVTTRRELGVFKRRRATPVAPWVLVAGQSLATTALAAGTTVVVLVAARAAYGVGVCALGLAAVAVAGLLGSATFAALAHLAATVADSPEAAQPLVQMTMLPLYFVSGVWIPTDALPGWLRTIGEAFPVEHLAAALHHAFVHPPGAGVIAWGDLGVLALWGAGGALLAARRFAWLPVGAG